MSNWVLLLPPSETKAAAPDSGPTWDSVRTQARYNAFAELDPMRMMVVRALHGALERRRGLEQMFKFEGKPSKRPSPSRIR